MYSIKGKPEQPIFTWENLQDMKEIAERIMADPYPSYGDLNSLRRSAGLLFLDYATDDHDKLFNLVERVRQIEEVIDFYDFAISLDEFIDVGNNPLHVLYGMHDVSEELIRKFEEKYPEFKEEENDFGMVPKQMSYEIQSFVDENSYGYKI